jgi:hypothetical protein
MSFLNLGTWILSTLTPLITCWKTDQRTQPYPCLSPFLLLLFPRPMTKTIIRFHLSTVRTYRPSWRTGQEVGVSILLNFPNLIAPRKGLNHDQPLSEFGYAVNDEIKALICIACKKGVPADMVRSHCKTYHPGREVPSVSKQREISQALSDTGIKSSTSLKYTQAPGQKPVDGLQVLQGYTCPLYGSDGARCSQAFLATSTFLRHLSTHPVHPKPDPASCTSSIQTLFAMGGLQVYFPVETSLSAPDPPLSSVYTDVLPLLRSLPAPQIQVTNNDKERASIHWFTRWPELLEPYCKDEDQVHALRSLVSFPEPGDDPDWLVRVQDHGCRWWEKAESAHVSCSYRASVLLKSHQEYVSPVLT